MSPDTLNNLAEYIMLLTARAIQTPGAEPSLRELELYTKLTGGCDHHWVLERRLLRWRGKSYRIKCRKCGAAENHLG